MPIPPISIFMSYARTDSSFVDRLEADLRARNFSTWVDRHKIEGGQVWLDELEQAIDRCQIVLVILSPVSVISKFVRMEYRYAQGLGKPVIPLEYQTCPKVPIDLNSLQWINFTQAYDKGLNDLLIALTPVRSIDIPTPDASSASQNAPLSLASTPQESNLVAPAPASPAPEVGLLELYRAGIIARARQDLERSAILWQQVLDREPHYQSGMLASQMARLQAELYPVRVKHLSDQAAQAHTAGAWGQEIGALQALLALQQEGELLADTSELPTVQQKRNVHARIELAKKHQNCAWMYESAQQFVNEQDFDAASIQLELLWQEDAEYGDPAGLAEQIGATSPGHRETLHAYTIPRFKREYTGTYTNQSGKENGITLIFAVQDGANFHGQLQYGNTNSSPFHGSINQDNTFTFTVKNVYYTGSIDLDGMLEGSWQNIMNRPYHGTWRAEPKK